MKQRDRYFDFLRGIAIIMVVGIHTLPSIKSIDSVSTWIMVFIRQLLNCAVPLFIAISGYFIAKKDLTSRQNMLRFWKRQISAVYIPCLLWSLGWLILSLYANGTGNILKKLVILVVCGYSVYYFIAVIIQMYFLTPLLSRYNNRGGVIVCAIVSAVSIMMVTYMIQIEGRSFPLILYAGPSVLWIVFFMIGMWYSKNSGSNNVLLGLALIIVGLIGSIIEIRNYFPLHGGGLGIKFSSFVFSAGVILLLFSKDVRTLFRENGFTSIILFIGDISFGIYFTHVFTIAVLGHFHNFDNWALKWLTVLIVTIVMIAGAKYILPKNIAKKYLGLR